MQMGIRPAVDRAHYAVAFTNVRCFHHAGDPAFGFRAPA